MYTFFCHFVTLPFKLMYFQNVCKIYCREVIKSNLYGKYIENSNIQRNIKKILHLVQEFYFEINVKFKQKS